MMMKFNKKILFILFLSVVIFSFGVNATRLLSVSDGIRNPYNQSVWRGNITFNFTTNAPAMNVTFHFVTVSGSGSGTIPVNITVFNDTASDTYWNLTVNSIAGTSGGTMVGTWVTTSGSLNVTLTIQNFSYPGVVTEPAPELNKTLLGGAQGGGLSYYNIVPEVAPLNFTFNNSNTNNQNFTGNSNGLTVYVNLTVVEKSNSQASCQSIGGVKYILYTSSGAVADTQFLLSNQSVTTCNDIVTYSGRKGVTYWNITAPLSNAPDDVYSMFITANDTVLCGGNGVSGGFAYCAPNLNQTTTLSFALDSTPPNVTSFVMNYSNASNLSLSSLGKIEFNVTANDSTTSVQSVKFGYTSSNGTELNLSATRNSSTWSVELPVGTLIDGLFRINYYVNDSLNNLNQSRNSSVGVLSFTLDRVAPVVSSFWMNLTNASNLSSSLVSLLYFNATVNDSTLTTQEVRFGLYNGNATGVNITGVKNAAGVWTANVTASQLSDGVFTVLISANDTADNRNNTVSNLTFTLDRTAPNVTGFVMNYTNATNLSLTSVRKIEFNITTNDSTTIVQSVKLGFSNGNGTELNLSASRNSSSWSIELATSAIADGIYTIQYYVNDSLNNFNQSQNSPTGPLTFRLDRTAPNVTNITFGNYTNGIALGPVLANKTGSVLINVTAFINDTLGVQNVLFNVTNSSGTVLGLSLSGSHVVEYWNASSVVNVSALAEGTYYINVIANDTVANVNRTQNFTFIIDRSAPTATVSCSPSSVTVGDSVACTCSGTDTFSSIASNTFTGGSSTQSTATTSTGTGTSLTCTVVDSAGNSATATGSWTVNVAAAASTGSSSGGGAGGSSSGVSTGVKDQFEKKVWTSINKGETATVDVKNGVISISQVSFAVDKTVYGPWIQVQKVDKLPAEVKSLKSEVYTYVQINSNNVKDALNGMVDVKFKVPNTWISEKKLSTENVALLHFDNNQWAQLKTAFVSDDGTYSWFTAQTPSFSYFAVGEAITKSVVSTSAPSSSAQKVDAVSSESSTPSEMVSSSTNVNSSKNEVPRSISSKMKWVWIVIGAIVLIVLISVFTRRKSSSVSVSPKNKWDTSKKK